MVKRLATSIFQIVKHVNNPTTVKRLHTNDRLPNAPTNLWILVCSSLSKMGFSHWIPQPCIPSYQLDLWDVSTNGRLHADSLSWSSVTWWKFILVNKFKKPGNRSIHQGDQIPLRLSLMSQWKLKCWIYYLIIVCKNKQECSWKTLPSCYHCSC